MNHSGPVLVAKNGLGEIFFGKGGPLLAVKVSQGTKRLGNYFGYQKWSLDHLEVGLFLPTTLR